MWIKNEVYDGRIINSSRILCVDGLLCVIVQVSG